MSFPNVVRLLAVKICCHRVHLPSENAPIFARSNATSQSAEQKGERNTTHDFPMFTFRFVLDEYFRTTDRVYVGRKLRAFRLHSADLVEEMVLGKWAMSNGLGLELVNDGNSSGTKELSRPLTPAAQMVHAKSRLGSYFRVPRLDFPPPRFHSS